MNYRILVIVFIASAIATGALRHYALAHNMIDIPNERSSHTIPTPRGGGLAIVFSFVLGLIGLWLNDEVAGAQTLAMVGAGSIVALVGFLDDHGHIDARWRLLTHFTAAIWSLIWLGGAPPIILLNGSIQLGWFGTILTVFYLVWLLNLYNFMDGIDGIAGIECVSVCFCIVILYLMKYSFDANCSIPALLASAVLGFLLWNFPPAKIFMGDAGSGFLGQMLGIISLFFAWKDPLLLWCWIILLSVFISDATVTLFRRLFHGEKIYEAHRSHAYQHAAQKSSHKLVTNLVAILNFFWLLPIAAMVANSWINPLLGTSIAYLPLILLAFYFNAGVNK